MPWMVFPKQFAENMKKNSVLEFNRNVRDDLRRKYRPLPPTLMDNPVVRHAIRVLVFCLRPFRRVLGITKPARRSLDELLAL